MGCVQSRRRGAREGGRQRDGGEDELCGARGTSVRRRLCGGGFSGEAPGIFVAEAASPRHEGGSLDSIYRGTERAVASCKIIFTLEVVIPTLSNAKGRNLLLLCGSEAPRISANKNG